MDSKAVIGTIRDFLDKEELHYSYDEEAQRFRLGFNLDCTLKRADFVLDVGNNGDACAVMGFTNIKVKDNSRREVEHLLFNITSKLSWGSWQINDSNEILFFSNITLDGDDAVLTYEMLDWNLYGTTSILEGYIDSILAVSSGAASADDELEKLFMSDDEEEEEQESEKDTHEGISEDDPITFLLMDSDTGNDEK